MIVFSNVDENLGGRVTEFLLNEIKMLEDNKCGEWINLLTEDVKYVMKVSLTSQGSRVQGNDMYIFQDDRESLTVRCEKFRTSYNWVETPPSVLRFHPSIVMVRREGDAVEVEMSALVFLYRGGRSDVVSMKRRDQLMVGEGGRLAIRSREIELDSDIPNVMFSRIL